MRNEVEKVANIENMEEIPFENVALFVVKLWKMLSRPEAVGILSWDSSGKSFVIHNQAQFATMLLPMYFKHKNVNSFVRQLNTYDFHKISFENKGDKLEYQHKDFQKDRPDLLVHIKRKLPQSKMPNKENSESVKNLSREMIALKKEQQDALRRINLLQLENASLAKEIDFLHARNNEQQKILRRLIEIFTKNCKYESNRMARTDCIEPKCLVVGSWDGYNNFMDLRDLLISDQPMELTDMHPNNAEMNEEIFKDLDDLENDISNLLKMSREQKL